MAGLPVQSSTTCGLGNIFVSKDGDSDFDPAGAGDDDDDYKGAGSQFKRPTQTVIRSSHITGGPRKRTAKTFQHMIEITQFLASIPRNIDEIPFHPAFLKHRYNSTNIRVIYILSKSACRRDVC